MQGNANQTPHKQPQHSATWMTPRCGIDCRQGSSSVAAPWLLPNSPAPQCPGARVPRSGNWPEGLGIRRSASTASICSMCRVMCGCKYNLLHSVAHIPMAHNFIGLPAMHWDAFPWLRWQQTESTVPRWHWHPLWSTVYTL